MATFTTTIKSLIDNDFDFGLKEYPIWKEEYRGEQDGNRWVSGLNRKILDHFYYYEIGQETPDMFKFMLNRKMNEVMPYFNQLYASEALILDPFETLDVTNTTDGEVLSETGSTESSEQTGVGTSTSKSRAVNSAFPQTMLNDSGSYATGANDSWTDGESSSTNSGSSSTEGTGKVNEARTLNMKGTQGSKAALLMQYRETMLNLDMGVINELNPLFMGLFDIADQSMERKGRYYGPYYNGLWPYL